MENLILKTQRWFSLFGNVIIKQSPHKRISQSLKKQLIKPNISPFAYLNFYFRGALLVGQSYQVR